MLLIYLDLTILLFILVADISLNWVMAGRDSSAGRTGLGSALLDVVIIGVELLVGRPLLSKHLTLLFLALSALLNLTSTLLRWLALCVGSSSICKCWLVLSLLYMLGVRWLWQEA